MTHRNARRQSRARWSALLLLLASTALGHEARASEQLPLAFPVASGGGTNGGDSNLPSGTVELGDFHFAIGQRYQSSPANDSMTLPMEVEEPRSVLLLLNSYDTWTAFDRAQLGTVGIGFDDGTWLETPLVIGENVREWRQGGGTVNTATDAALEEVDRTTTSDGAAPAVTDLLTIPLPSDVWGKTLTSVTVTDTLLEDNGRTNGVPGILWSGITVTHEPVRVVYVRDGELWLAERDGSQARQLTHGCRECANPALSPDGRTVAYLKLDDTYNALSVGLLDVATDTSTWLGWVGDTTPRPRPRFSADGAYVVYHEAAFGGVVDAPNDVVSISVERTERRKLTDTRKRDERNPSLSPDGQMLAYVSRGRIYVSLIGTKKRRALVRRGPDFTEADDPVFSADGSRVLFTGRKCIRRACVESGVFSVDLDGRNMIALSEGVAGAALPSSTPNGRTIAFTAPDGVWTVSSEGTNRVLLQSGAEAAAFRSSVSLPAGCYKRSQVDVCYRPFRALRNTPLLTAPDARAPQVQHGGQVVTVAANAYIGRQSVRNPECSNTPPLRDPVNGYVWGYLSLQSGGHAAGKSGWMLASDLVGADDFGGALCGPAKEDFDCRPAFRSKCDSRDACGVGSNDHPRDASGDRQLTRPEYVHMAADSTPSLWLLAGDRVRRHGMKSSSFEKDFACVEVLISQFVAKGRAGWVRADALGPLPPVCGNGKKEAGEQCDDRNSSPCDGCDNQCQVPGCGNGRVECGEECDDGNRTNGDGCDANCYKPRFKCDVQCCDGAWAGSGFYALDAGQCQTFANSNVCRDHGGWSGVYFNGQWINGQSCGGRCSIECCRYSASPPIFRAHGPDDCRVNLLCEAQGTGKRNVYWVPDGGVGQRLSGPNCPSS